MKTLLQMPSILSCASALALAPAVSHGQWLGGTGQVGGGLTGSLSGALRPGQNTDQLGGDLSGTLDGLAKVSAQNEAAARQAAKPRQTARNAKTNAELAARQSADLSIQAKGTANVTGPGTASNNATTIKRLNTITDAQAQGGINADVAPYSATSYAVKRAGAAALDVNLLPWRPARPHAVPPIALMA